MDYTLRELFVLSSSGRVKRSFDVGFAGFFLTTLGSWLVFFLFCFVYNSACNLPFVTHPFVVVFVFVVFNLWHHSASICRFYCRIHHAKLRVQQRLIQEGIKNKVMYEGTALDPTKNPKSEAPSGPSWHPALNLTSRTAAELSPTLNYRGKTHNF